MNLLLHLHVFFYFFLSSCGSRQTESANPNSFTICEHCNIENLKRLRFSKVDPNLNEMGEFLKCFNRTCHLNIEYSAASNYSIFLFIQNYPIIFMNALDKNINLLDVNYIETILQNPVDESIDVRKSIESLENDSIRSEYKERLIKALQVALSKN